MDALLWPEWPCGIAMSNLKTNTLPWRISERKKQKVNICGVNYQHSMLVINSLVKVTLLLDMLGHHKKAKTVKLFIQELLIQWFHTKLMLSSMIVKSSWQSTTVSWFHSCQHIKRKTSTSLSSSLTTSQSFCRSWRTKSTREVQNTSCQTRWPWQI